MVCHPEFNARVLASKLAVGAGLPFTRRNTDLSPILRRPGVGPDVIMENIANNRGWSTMIVEMKGGCLREERPSTPSEFNCCLGQCSTGKLYLMIPYSRLSKKGRTLSSLGVALLRRVTRTSVKLIRTSE